MLVSQGFAHSSILLGSTGSPTGGSTDLETSKRIFSGQKRALFFPSDMPSAECIVFKDSSFFQRNGSTSVLPSPSEVLAEAHIRGVQTDFRPPPVHYPSLGLTVKYGHAVSTTEGRCLWAIRKSLGDAVPVPEVYGWTKEGGVSYIYMEYIPGETLSNRWDSLSDSEKRDICDQLRTMVGHLRTIQQPDGEKFIGTISRQPLLDYVFTTSAAPPMGPFASVAEFHDLFVKLPDLQMPDPNDSPHPFRGEFPDDVPVVFTHADLNPSNIIISPATEQGMPRVKALIDWGQSGWYPIYWEYCKALWTVDPEEEWGSTYIPLFLEHFDCFIYWDFFLLSMGI
ncbi:hypothetical protein RSOLAG22IIIB_05939 [Rhizoctonia solani]|uniref:Aminoglycoside phosphotransferase domain-containing protein n=1 Tax=Rhizoctonia solani TaxID=456999 RepID=A0A0K6GAP8_9AGAM|nr:hypothetical protein RSOLAG22IIIB_05939 [Rhizoctonia solani]